MSLALVRKAWRLKSLAGRPRVLRDMAAEMLHGRFGEAARIARAASEGPDLGAEKIVSHRFQCLWLCVPKVASRSIARALAKADPAAEVISGRSLAALLADRPELTDYFRFAFVRSPVARALSLHAELQFGQARNRGAQRRFKREKREWLFARCPGLKQASSFGAFCRWLATPYGSDEFADRHFLSQHLQIRGADGRLPDFVGRLENLDADWSMVAAKLGLPAEPLPMLNTMAGWDADASEARALRQVAERSVTPASRALLRVRYAEDFQLVDVASTGDNGRTGLARRPTRTAREPETGAASNRGGARPETGAASTGTRTGD